MANVRLIRLDFEVFGKVQGKIFNLPCRRYTIPMLTKSGDKFNFPNHKLDAGVYFELYTKKSEISLSNKV